MRNAWGAARSGTDEATLTLRLGNRSWENIPNPAASPSELESALATVSYGFLLESGSLLVLHIGCLSRRTIDNVRHSAHEPSPETRAALELAIQLLDPSHQESIAGWRDSITAEGLAELLVITCQHAQDRLRGRKTWQESERGKLVRYLKELRARLAQPYL
jgi:hypothetical protein